ncbi:MAG: YdcF family protein [Verrucomicrobia bacterium]|nr:YdcF family protein [Verrucomicrobiota bacterium]
MTTSGFDCSPSSWSFARGLALFLSGFTLLNAAGVGGLNPGHANLWWIDLRAFGAPVSWLLEVGFAGALLAWVVRPEMGASRRRMTLALTGLFLAFALINAATVSLLLVRGGIQNPHGVTLSGCLSLALTGLLWAQHARPPVQRGWGNTLAAGAIIALGFPLLQAFCFGKTDYRRPAQVALVLGARVYADGQLSDAVADRVRTAAELYREGWVERLIVSGGPGDGAVHETEAMQRYAESLGVPASALSADPLGFNTAATVKNTRIQLAGQRVLVVSEFYHLPRLKLAFAQAGIEVFTVPAKPDHWLRNWPIRSLIREVPAFWLYWWRGSAR